MIFILLLAMSFCAHIFSIDPMMSKNAEQILDSIAYPMPSRSIIGKREWNELQLDRLVTILDRTKTSFGRWGLVQLLHPIADEKELEHRKKIITFLVEHEDEMHIFQEQLERVHDLEASLLAYWNRHDQLHMNATQFYYSLFGSELNKSSLALNASAMVEMFNSWKYLLTTLALGGLTTEFNRWLFSEDKEKKFDIWHGIFSGLEYPLKQHSPYFDVIEQPTKSSYEYKDYMKAFTYGSWRDRYEVLLKGYDFKGKRMGFGMLGSFVGATIPTLFFDYQWGSAITSTAHRIISMNRTLNELQKRVSDVAQCIDAIKKLQAIVVEQAPALRAYFDEDDGYDIETEKFIRKLLTGRFLKKPGYFYSRGHVLAMHYEIFWMKTSLVPLLHSIALLDAYCSITQLYKESQNKSAVFSFVEFIETQKPFLQYHDTWLALLPSNEAVVNNLMLGGTYPGKIIITGPNGGGKSTILKNYAIDAILAQSWGIVPAQSAQQTLFTAIRTSLVPHEDLQHGLSTFMAEKKAMSDLLDDIKDLQSDDRMLVLIDEPYKGTVDDESAKRIYQFGKDIAGYSQLLVAIATHVKKPIFLTEATGGIFGNYQVKIDEIKSGIFKRLFTIEQGPATWWFEDEAKRGRFIDWISVATNFEE